MPSETIFAYVGPKGSGKSHEGAKRVVDAARSGRGVVIVNPDFRLDRLAEHLKIDLKVLSRYVRVCDYDDVDKEGFWPNEEELKLARDVNGILEPGPKFRPDGWRRNIVRAGDVVIIDEAWRWLEHSSTIPARFKTALHMARHWRGPLDWRDPDDVDRYLDDELMWHPGLGGEKILGGDGTELVSMNILLLTQDYRALDQKLRRQVDQITDLNSYKDGSLPPWLQRFVPSLKTDGHYGASTFLGHRLPERNTKAYQADRFSFEKLPHLPEIHRLLEKAGGQALETRVDSRGGLNASDRWKRLKWMALGILALICVPSFFAISWFSNLTGEQSKKTAADLDPSKLPSSSEPTSFAQNSGAQPPQPAAPRSSSYRLVGTVKGDPVVVDNSGRITMVDKSQMTSVPQLGLIGSVNGETVSKWSAPIIPADSSSGGGRNRGTTAVDPAAASGPGSNYINRAINGTAGASLTNGPPAGN